MRSREFRKQKDQELATRINKVTGIPFPKCYDWVLEHRVRFNKGLIYSTAAIYELMAFIDKEQPDE